MATFNFLSTKDLGEIAPKLGSWMPEMDDWQSCQIGESIEVYTVGLGNLFGAGSAKSCLRKTHRWHLQVRVDEKASYCARVYKERTKDKQEGEWDIYSFYGPGKAEKIDAAVTWIDQYVHDRYAIRIVEIPAFYITALLLEDGEDVHVYVVDAPAGVSIERETLRRFDELRGELRTQSPIDGVTA